MAVLQQPGWVKVVYTLWRDVSRLIQPFYGDVRILDYQSWGGMTVKEMAESDRHPVISWWWRGIPSDLGNAVVLGDVYQRYWLKFVNVASVVDGLAFVSTRDWLVKRNLALELGGVPIPLVQPPAVLNAEDQSSRILSNPENQKYPDLWPFGGPFRVQ